MPPKPKLHKSTAKSKIKSNISEPQTLDPELQQQFETELCWCIQQLQRTLKSGKLNEKQVEESTKILNILMSNSTPFIKKRQIMRVNFGDYRAKMAEEDAKLSKVLTNIKIKPVEPSKKSVFMKKSCQNSSTSDFKFNFVKEDSEDTESKVADNLSKIDLKPEDGSSSFKFVLSDNSFRFNFEDIPS